MRNTRHRLRAAASGLSLIELMISITIGLFILAGMVSIFASSSQSHQELEKASRQIENGRYSTQMLREDIELAGFFGDYLPISSATWTTPDPCTTILNDMQFAATTPTVPTGIFGYEGGAGLSANCTALLANRRAATDILVLRRVGTEAVVIDSDENNAIDGGAAITAGRYYLQVSNCADTPAENAFVLGRTSAAFGLHKVKPAGTPPSCKNGGLSPIRPYVVRIYYVATCNNCTGAGDGIPTLKMAELTADAAACSADPAVACGNFNVVSVAEGVEDLQLEYGIDTAGSDGAADAYQTATGLADWSSVVAVKAFVLARNTEATSGYVNDKLYALNSNGDTTGLAAPGDNYKRNVFMVTARANNISGRRQQ